MTYEDIVEFMRKNLKKADAKKIDAHIAVEFDIYGEGEGAFYVGVNNGSLAVEPYEYYDRDAKVIVTADELVKIFSEGKNPKESIEEGILMLEGDSVIAQKLFDLAKKPVKKAAEAKKKPAAKKKETAPKAAQKKEVKAAKVVKAEEKIVDMASSSKSNALKKDIKK